MMFCVLLWAKTTSPKINLLMALVISKAGKPTSYFIPCAASLIILVDVNISFDIGLDVSCAWVGLYKNLSYPSIRIWVECNVPTNSPSLRATVGEDAGKDLLNTFALPCWFACICNNVWYFLDLAFIQFWGKNILEINPLFLRQLLKIKDDLMLGFCWVLRYLMR